MALPFGRYMLMRKLAAGGMGQVLLARKGAEGFEKLVVIKRILPHLVEDEEFFQMFVDEAKIAMRLDHPNIARINEFGEEGGVHFLEMEYIAGEDIRRIDKRARATGTPIPLGVILRVIADAAAGLDFAHKARDSKGQPLNLVHRDVSPQNVLVGFDGSVKIIDFGVAKAAGRAQHTATGILKGKFPYMSPEQAEGLELDARSDVFALGVVLWELLTGRRLFKGDNDLMSQRLVRACQVTPPSELEPSLPKELDPLVMKALAKSVEDRYPDAGAFRTALENFALKNGIPTSTATVAEFLAPLYAERIELENDPRSLEDDSGLTGLDAAGGALPGPAGAATKVEGSRKTGAQAGQTVALAEGGGGKGLKFAALGAVGLLALVGLAIAFKPKPVEPAPVVTPVVPLVAPVIAPLPVVPAVAPTPLVITLSSEPAGAEVELAGLKVGLTPMELKLERARLPSLLKLTHDGYETWAETLTEATTPTLAVPLKKKASKAPPTQRPPDIKTTR